MQVNVLEAKNRLSQLIQSARAGEEVVIANRGQPVARLVASNLSPASTKSGEASLLRWLEAHPLPDHARRTQTQMESAIKAERAAWD